jgi:ubiquinone biosynthesis protein
MKVLGQHKKRARLGRYYHIAEVLVRHGFGFALSIFGLDGMVPFRKDFRNREKSTSRPEHIRLVFEELGPTFIKLGQILSTRSDLLPPEYIVELAKLQDQAPPVPFNQIKETIELEFGKPLNEVFATFDSTPLAAASIGQVHCATLHDGSEVVVKVRRPGVVEQVTEDLEILQNLAFRAQQYWKQAENYDLVGIIQEFAQVIRAEMDYLQEARNAEQIAKNFAESKFIKIPRVHWKYTGNRVITLERIYGIKINDLDAVDKSGVNRRRMAVQATNAIMKMFYEDGFFHADLHPGNFFIVEDGRVALVDFGMVGVLDDRTRELMVQFVISIASKDIERLVDVFIMLGATRSKIDRVQFRRDLSHLVEPYYHLALGEIALDLMLDEALIIVRRHNLQLPSNMMLLLKTFMMSEGMGRQLDPKFHLIDIIIPYSKQLMLQQYSPEIWIKKFGRASLDAAQLGTELPSQMRRLLSELERGNMQVGVKHNDLDEIMVRLERLTNRVIISVITAAFIIALAVLTTVYRLQVWDQFAGIVIILGFLLSSAMGLYLAWTILRGNRR